MRVQFGNDLQEWDDAREMLYANMFENHMPVSEIVSFLVAVEELVANIISYAYVDSNTNIVNGIEITVEYEYSSPKTVEIICQLTDYGIPFDPLCYCPRNPDESTSKISFGGWGIFLARSKVDAMTYHRDGDKNIVTLKKSI